MYYKHIKISIQQYNICYILISLIDPDEQKNIFFTYTHTHNVMI